MLLLKVTPAEGEPFDYTVEGESLTIGRSTRCDVTIADRFLSRQHARLFQVDDEWFVEDQGSRNGTFINGRRIDQAAPVNSGDVIALSSSLIKLVRDPTAEAGSAVTTEVPSTDRLLRPAAELLRRTESPPPDATDNASSALARYAARLALLNEVHQAVARSAALEELLELILDKVFAQLHPERAEVFIRCDDGSYSCVASRRAPGSTLASLYSESLFTEVVDKAMAALVTDARSDDRFANAQSLVSAGVRSLIAAPFYDPDRALGLIVLGSNAALRTFQEEDLELLATLASVAALRIRNMTLSQEAAERQRLEREIGLARRLQVRLLPERLPDIEGYLMHGAAKPSRGVSGDYYQVVQRADRKECVVALADVSGKGMSAAILTGYLDALSSVPIEDGLAPHEIFRRVSGKLFHRTPANKFATMFLGVLEPGRGIVRYANAGHSPACLVRTDGAVEWLGTTGLPLGLLPSNDYELGEAVIEPGDTLVVYSDGYTEAENPADEEFGPDRLAEVCVANRDRQPAELAEAVDRALESFAAGRSFADDRTMVILRRIG